MKLQLRKNFAGFLVLTDEQGRTLPCQVSTEIISEHMNIRPGARLRVEFDLGDGIELSSEPAS